MQSYEERSVCYWSLVVVGGMRAWVTAAEGLGGVLPKEGPAVARHGTAVTLGFQVLARESSTSEKSLMRILGPNGNHGLFNLSSIVRMLNKHADVCLTARAELADAPAT